MTDDEAEPAGAGRFETFDANRSFVVVRDDDGYGVWRLDDLEDGEPLERFPDDDAGYEAAAARWRSLSAGPRLDRALTALKWVVIVSAALWVISSLAVGVFFVAFQGGSFDESGSVDELFQYMQLIQGVANASTLGALAVFVVVWLDRRR